MATLSGPAPGVALLLGQSAGMQAVYRILLKVAASMHPVLILGETGTGKELVAREIHAAGANASRPFVVVDCGALVPTLIESELFGHVRGAFTGAERAREGLLSAAAGGTVLLDEIGELPPGLQVKLLRAVQEREVRPVGSSEPVPMRARVLAATHRDLARLVDQGRFRRDLYFRLNVVTLRVPALRDRREDIPLLTEHFLARAARERGVPLRLSREVLAVLMEYAWPGNVRELENAIERLAALTSGEVLELAHLPTQLQTFERKAGRTAMEAMRALPPQESAVTPIAELERAAILKTIRKLKGDKVMAAKLLGIGKTTLYRKLKEYGIDDGEGS